MALILEQGWIVQAQKVASPNYNRRPFGMSIELVVIHGISLPPGTFGGLEIERLFCNQLDPKEHPYYVELQGLKVSAHFLIRRTGALIQFVSTEHRAWHAGESQFLGRSNCNDFSIGIELEGTDEIPYTEAQYHSLLPLLAILRENYPLIRGKSALVGHSDIAPGRKTDPGPVFDWERVQKEFSELINF